MLEVGRSNENMSESGDTLASLESILTSRIRSLLKEAICTGHSQALHAAFQPVSWHTVPGYSLFPYP